MEWPAGWNYYTQFAIYSRFLVQLGVFGALIIGATVLYLALHGCSVAMKLKKCMELRRVVVRGFDGKLMEITPTISSVSRPR